jgi:hypothetical protein
MPVSQTMSFIDTDKIKEVVWPAPLALACVLWMRKRLSRHSRRDKRALIVLVQFIVFNRALVRPRHVQDVVVDAVDGVDAREQTIGAVCVNRG